MLMKASAGFIIGIVTRDTSNSPGVTLPRLDGNIPIEHGVGSKRVTRSAIDSSWAAIHGRESLLELERIIDAIGVEPYYREKETEMKKYRKKPVVVEAVRYLPTKENHKTLGQEIIDWSGDGIVERVDPDDLSASSLWIEMLGDGTRVNYGDWIVKDIDRNFYPCKPDIFEATYEEVKR
jgi:hypothetical protein